MPRISRRLLRQAQAISPLLALLLRPCRNLRLAYNELRWLKEHALREPQKLRLQASASKPEHNRTRERRKLRRYHNTNGATEAVAAPGWRTLLARHVSRRARGEPLQYIIGTQPFGELDILCRPGVLIPRPETEQIVEEAAELIKDWIYRKAPQNTLNINSCLEEGKFPVSTEADSVLGSDVTILDLCTGTGCIPLLLSDLLRRTTIQSERKLSLVGVDISSQALSLARQNRSRSLPKPLFNCSVKFVRADVLDTTIPILPRADNPFNERAFDKHQIAPPVLFALHHLFASSDSSLPKVNILISNPPYVSPTAYSNGTTDQSVRRYEPRLALVPPPMSSTVPRGDEFYAKILELAKHTEASVVIFEVGDPGQALRVQRMMVEDGWEHYVKIWEIGGPEGVRAVVGVKDEMSIDESKKSIQST
ncbi:MAG: hypothetical protein Q9160_007306 [Pyrenula sp. 1 TL-2023]